MENIKKTSKLIKRTTEVKTILWQLDRLVALAERPNNADKAYDVCLCLDVMLEKLYLYKTLLERHFIAYDYEDEDDDGVDDE